MIKSIVCTPKHLPKSRLVDAAKVARQVNPFNHPHVEQLTRLMPGFKPTPQRIAVVTKKYWGTRGVKLTVGFLDGPETALRSRLLEHMNAWGKSANVGFVQTKTNPQVRIARVENDGYWSYLGTDILLIPPTSRR